MNCRLLSLSPSPADSLWIALLDLLWGASLAALSLNAAGDEVGPREVLEVTTARVVETLATSETRSANSGHDEQLRAELSALFAPLLDIEAASKLVLGVHWRDATTAQRARFGDALRAMLLGTYSESLTSARGLRMEVLDVTRKRRADRADVKSLATTADGSRINVVYRMRTGPDGWRVFDLVLDGVSLIGTYKHSIRAAVRRDGIESLIKTLEGRYGHDP